MNAYSAVSSAGPAGKVLPGQLCPRPMAPVGPMGPMDAMTSLGLAKVRPEGVQLLAYFSFALMMLVSVAITKRFGGLTEEKKQQTLLVQHFGYNNICLYLDYPPATYFTPAMWSVTLVLWTGATTLTWLRARDYYHAGRLSQNIMRLVRMSSITEIILYFPFSICFAIQPFSHATLAIHTLPFTAFLAGTASHSYTHTLVGIFSGYWHSIGMPAAMQQGAVLVSAAFICVCVFKMIYQFYFLFIDWPPSPAMAELGQFMDMAFMVLYLVPFVGLCVVWVTQKDTLEPLVVASWGDTGLPQVYGQPQTLELPPALGPKLPHP